MLPSSPVLVTSCCNEICSERGGDVESTELEADAVMELPGAQRCPLLAQLPARELDLVLSTAQVSQYERRDPLYPGRTVDDAVHVLLRGAFFERVRHPEGQGSYAHPLAAGEAVGLTDTLIGVALDREVRALLPSAALRIPGATVRGLAGASGAVAAAIAETGLRELRRAEADRIVLAASDATGRVLRRMSDLVVGWGRATAKGTDITLPLTQEQLGAWAGSSRETTVKILQWLRERGLIETSRRHLLVVDPEAIATLAASRGVTPAGGGQEEASSARWRSSPRARTWPQPRP